MKRAAVFFDRDNTLVVGADYLGDPDDVALMPGAADAVSRARALGYATIIVSNQSGVARGMFSEADVRAVNARIEEYLLSQNPNAVIDRQEFCPFLVDAPIERYRRDSELRKPKPGMLFKAADVLALDLRRSWMIGDAPRDIQAGYAAGCRTILFQPADVEPSPAASDSAGSSVKPDFTCTTLKEAIDIISSHTADDTPSMDEPPFGNLTIPTTDDTDRRITNALAGSFIASKPVPNDGPADEMPRDEAFAEEAFADEVIADASPIDAPPAVVPPAAVPAEVEDIPEPEEPPALRIEPDEPPPASDPAPLQFAPVKEEEAEEPVAPAPANLTHKLEQLSEQILELLKRREQHPPDFSVSKLIAGITQILAIAILFVAFLNRDNNDAMYPRICTAIFCQLLTISLLIMDQQK